MRFKRWPNPHYDWLFWVVLAWAIIATISVVRGETYPTHDKWGYKYPVECRRDLTYLLGRIVVRRGADLGHSKDGRKTIGYWWSPTDPNSMDRETIFVDKSIVNRSVQEDIIQHELCHAEMYRLYGSPYWHKE